MTVLCFVPSWHHGLGLLGLALLGMVLARVPASDDEGATPGTPAAPSATGPAGTAEPWGGAFVFDSSGPPVTQPPPGAPLAPRLPPAPVAGPALAAGRDSASPDATTAGGLVPGGTGIAHHDPGLRPASTGEISSELPVKPTGPVDGGLATESPGGSPGDGPHVVAVQGPMPGLEAATPPTAAEAPFLAPPAGAIEPGFGPVVPPVELVPPSETQHTVSLRVEEQDIRRALELLGSQAEVNILVSPGVGGPVTLDLQDVPFEDALGVLLKLGNLKVRRQGDILYVYTAAEYEAIEAAEREPIVRVFCLNYIRAVDLAYMVQPFLSDVGTVSVTPPSQQGIGGASASAMSGSPGTFGLGAGGGAGGVGGEMIAAGSSVSTGSDTGGNSLAAHDALIVRDYPENIAAVDQIVRKLDTQPLQVLIEAVILSVELTDDQQLGVNFALIDNLATAAAVSGSGAAINAAAGFTPAQVLSTAVPQAGFLGDRPGQLISGYLPDQGLKFGFVSDNVSGFVRALETLNKVDVLASPRVLVLNKQRAEIQLGRRLGYRNTVTNLTSSLETVQFLSVGTLLTLRPFVSGDGMIRLEIHPERSTGELDIRGIPQTNTSELTTNILVPDGATIVIGGLIDSEDRLGEEGVLGLSRLPVVGPLFRARRTRVDKRELIVLLTPRILNQHGLPRPVPGVAPTGPAGIPNTGPMPGPSALDGPPPHPDHPPGAIPPILEDSYLLGHRSLEDYARGDAKAASGLMIPEPGAAGSESAHGPAGRAPAPTGPVPDPRVLPASTGPATVPSMAPEAGHRQASGVLRSPPAAAPTARTDQGYQPGDLTRAAIHRMTQPFARGPRTGGSPPVATPPPTPRRPEPAHPGR